MYDFQKKIANTAYHKPHTIGGEISRKEFIREDPMEKLKRKNDFHGVLADPAENELLKGTIQEFFEATLPDITITGRLSVLFFGQIFRNPLKVPNNPLIVPENPVKVPESPLQVLEIPLSKIKKLRTPSQRHQNGKDKRSHTTHNPVLFRTKGRLLKNAKSNKSPTRKANSSWW